MTWNSLSCCCDWGWQVTLGRPCVTAETTGCSEFPSGMAANWELVVAGFALGACSDAANCTGRNGTFQLAQVSGCAFESPGRFANYGNSDVSPCSFSTDYRWRMSYNFPFGTLGWQLCVRSVFAGSSQTVYVISGTFDPLGSNTFDLLVSDTEGDCTGAPATLTVEPICE